MTYFLPNARARVMTARPGGCRRGRRGRQRSSRGLQAMQKQINAKNFAVLRRER